MCINCLSRDLSTSRSYRSILWVPSMCTSFINNVTTKVAAWIFFWLNSLVFFSLNRYIQYICDLSLGVIERPHFTELILKAINLSPVPLFNRERFVWNCSFLHWNLSASSDRNGCRPFVDIYNQDQKKIFSTYQEVNRLRWEWICPFLDFKLFFAEHFRQRMAFASFHWMFHLTVILQFISHMRRLVYQFKPMYAIYRHRKRFISLISGWWDSHMRIDNQFKFWFVKSRWIILLKVKRNDRCFF